MTSTDLMEAIAERIAALWPERMLYRDFCPKDYKRPSGFLYVINAGFEDVNIGLVRWSVEAELELFAATDAYTVESTEALRRDQDAVLDLFGGPSVQHRLMPGAEAPGPGSAYVSFSAAWTDVRPGYHDPEDPGDPETAQTPKMEHIEINNQYNKEERT